MLCPKAFLFGITKDSRISLRKKSRKIDPKRLKELDSNKVTVISFSTRKSETVDRIMSEDNSIR